MVSPKRTDREAGVTRSEINNSDDSYRPVLDGGDNIRTTTWEHKVFKYFLLANPKGDFAVRCLPSSRWNQKGFKERLTLWMTHGGRKREREGSTNSMVWYGGFQRGFCPVSEPCSLAWILKTPWPESTSELCLPSDRRLSSKLVPTFADRGCHVGSAEDPLQSYSRISRPEPLFFFQVAPQLYSRVWVDPVPGPLLLRKSGSASNRTRTSGSVARNSDH
jgi:hypothetical protein